MPLRPDPLDRRWRVEPLPDEALAAVLAQGLPAPLPFARLLVQRGVNDPESGLLSFLALTEPECELMLRWSIFPAPAAFATLP